VQQPAGSAPIPDVPAPAWIVADLDSGQVLAGRDQDVPHPPASTIKVLLALVVLDEVSLESTVVADAADTDVGCSCAGVRAGRTYSARQLLDGLLLVSGNDAANTLAHMLGGQEVAVDKMNAKALLLGAANTRASTPSGLAAPGDPPDPGTSTAHDLAVIFRAAMADPVFAEITAQSSAKFPGDDGDYEIGNVDELLQRYPGAIGGKTGFTPLAHETFVGAAARDDRRLVVAMMYDEAGKTYWEQAADLLDWGFALDPQSAIGTL
jgi:D-alanyl-D-alanine carboxypeptidase (penicillin-binding protein 5/6)